MTMIDTVKTLGSYPFHVDYTLNTRAIEKDGASVEAFKKYLDRQLLRDGVDRFEQGDVIAYAMDSYDEQIVGDNLISPNAHLEFQPWFRRYFTKVISVEPEEPREEDALAQAEKHIAQGWIHPDKDEFFPKK